MFHHLRILTLVFSAIAYCVLAILASAELAFAAPAKMLNKTVRYSFTVSAPAKRGDGSTLIASGTYSRTIYISSQGRIFDRNDRLERGGSKNTSDTGPESSGFRAEGNRLVGLFKHVSGASQIIVTFDNEFRSCTLTAMTGSETGRPVQFKGLNGITYTNLGKATYSNQTCSVTEGNAFGG